MIPIIGNDKCQYLTERQVADLLSISVSTLQKQRFHSTGIPYIKLGRAVRYAMSDVVAYMESAKITFAA